MSSISGKNGVDRVGNMPSLPGIFPDGMAPVVRSMADGQRQLLMMRWGFPSLFSAGIPALFLVTL
jgi:hypothetical protein